MNNNEEMMELIREDFERLTNYYGCPDLEMPEINFVTASNQEANFRLGACKFTTFPESINTVKVKSMSVLNIFVENAREIVEKIIGESSNTWKATRLFLAYIRYTAIHEMTHHIQMKLGLTVDKNKDVMEEIETKCTEATVDFVKKHMRGDKLMEYLSQLDMCALAEAFNKASKECIRETKNVIVDKICAFLKGEEEIMNEIEEC